MQLFMFDPDRPHLKPLAFHMKKPLANKQPMLHDPVQLDLKPLPLQVGKRKRSNNDEDGDDSTTTELTPLAKPQRKAPTVKRRATTPAHLARLTNAELLQLDASAAKQIVGERLLVFLLEHDARVLQTVCGEHDHSRIAHAKTRALKARAEDEGRTLREVQAEFKMLIARSRRPKTGEGSGALPVRGLGSDCSTLAGVPQTTIASGAEDELPLGTRHATTAGYQPPYFSGPTYREEDWPDRLMSTTTVEEDVQDMITEFNRIHDVNGQLINTGHQNLENATLSNAKAGVKDLTGMQDGSLEPFLTTYFGANNTDSLPFSFDFTCPEPGPDMKQDVMGASFNSDLTFSWPFPDASLQNDVFETGYSMASAAGPASRATNLAHRPATQQPTLALDTIEGVDNVYQDMMDQIASFDFEGAVNDPSMWTQPAAEVTAPGAIDPELRKASFEHTFDELFEATTQATAGADPDVWAETAWK